jgi:hypothetical protein
MNVDRERWAEALLVQKQHGAAAPRFVVELIGELPLRADHAGVQRWREIAGGLDQLRCGDAVSKERSFES